MTWISLVCLLALSSSAFAGYGQSNGYGSQSIVKMPSLLNVVRDQQIRRLPVNTVRLAPQGYGQEQAMEQTFVQQDLPKIQSGYGSSYSALPKSLHMHKAHHGYGSAPRILSFDQPQQVVQQVAILTEADQLCRGQAAETVIPLEGGRKFVVCLDDGKGAEQYCPKGLYYHVGSRRCERKLGQLENWCASQPCLNGGQCSHTETHYQCQCAPGFDGDNCELDARICQTQQPCGQSPDSRCQSFRTGAALQHICILQDGQAYGFSAGQAAPSPCNGVDGPHALTISNKGFIMCDGERMFVESCPGGTLWDDLNKACVWPDMQADLPVEKSYSYDSYSQPRQFIMKPAFEQTSYTQSYAPKVIRPVFEQRSFIQAPAQEYGSQITVQPIEKKFTQSYGSSMNFEQPKFLQAPVQGYGSSINLEQPKFLQAPVQGYGSQNVQPIGETRKITLLPSQDLEPQENIQVGVPQFKPTQSSGY